MKLRGRVLITAFDCVMLRYDAQTGQLMHIYTDRTLVRAGAHDAEEGMLHPGACVCACWVRL